MSRVARAANDWLASVQAQTLRGDLAAAQISLTQALAEHPASVELRRARAGIFQQVGRSADAEALLRGLLAEVPGDAASAFILARMLKEQGRTASLASVLRACFADVSNCRDVNLAINAIELLDDCDRKADASAIARAALGECPSDTRLHAYAGMLEIQLGEFERARQHYLYALRHDDRAWEWHVPIGLSSAQRYAGPEHPDFALFKDGLQRQDLPDLARAELHFALGKAGDDIGNHSDAARHFREGNAIAHRLTRWSRKDWRRATEARMASKPAPLQPGASAEFTPVFIVGMPRSGTTLLAQLLSRHPETCSRGELPWIANLAGKPALSGEPSRQALQDAAMVYAKHARQDDAGNAYWFIDKQPLNFRYIDLMLAMFPQARIIHCQRNARDTALSLWMQCFLEDVQGYAYDFDDMALVMRDCARLMANWSRRFPDSIRSIRYEQLVSEPDMIIGQLAAWIGLPSPQPTDANASTPAAAISTASLWQARQAVHSRSVGRWRHYLQHIPELHGFKPT